MFLTIFLISILPSANSLAQSVGVMETSTGVTNKIEFIEEQPRLLGHNLSTTSYTSKSGQVYAGAYEISYGISDQLMIGTSPWLIIAYNSPTLDFKYSYLTNSIFDQISHEIIYMKSLAYGFNRYEQEHLWFRTAATKIFHDDYRVHFNLGAQYAINDKVSHSMRPPPINRTPLTLSLSALQEVHLSNNFGMFVESGLLGLNYPNRYLQVGLSGFYRWKKGYIQLGLSKTYEIGPYYLSDYLSTLWQDHQLKISDGVYSSSIYFSKNQPFHPEIQIEFLL